VGQGGMITAEDYIIFYGRGNENHQLGPGFFVHHIKYLQLREQSLLVLDVIYISEGLLV